jgi:hypothetical protein
LRRTFSDMSIFVLYIQRSLDSGGTGAILHSP